MERKSSSVHDCEAAAGNGLQREGSSLDSPSEPGPEDESWISAQGTSQRDRLDPAPRSSDPFLQAENLTKTYMTGGRELRLFDGLNLSVEEGELVAIVGPSGAGKSTLLHMLGALDAPTSGNVYCGSTSLGTLTRKQASRFRNRQVGYVWQFHYLLPEFTAAENVAMPLLAGGVRPAEALDSARVWLELVGLAERTDHRSGELSGGEQQRVAIARALIPEPRLLLADEPTGDLDGDTAESVFALIESLHRSNKLTTVLVTHNMGLARRANRVLRLAKGRLEEIAPEKV